MKREIPILITLITGIFMVVTFFIPHWPFGDMEQRALIWFSIVSGFAMVLGIDSLLAPHFKNIIRRRAGWFHSALLIFGFTATLIAGLQSGLVRHSILAGDGWFMWVYLYIIVPLQGTMFSLLAFFIASAAYRAFRARTIVATLLLVSAVLVMLGRVPIGEALWSRFPDIQGWIMAIPQTAARRGIMIGIYLGAAATALRIILGIEKPYLN